MSLVFSQMISGGNCLRLTQAISRPWYGDDCKASIYRTTNIDLRGLIERRTTVLSPPFVIRRLIRSSIGTV